MDVPPRGRPHPTLPGLLADPTVRDEPAAWPVRESTLVHSDGYLSLRVDSIVDPAGAAHDRSVVQTYDAVAVVAVDDDDRLLLVDQYRHPVGRRLFEVPAGILDIDGEAPEQAAARELAEEADVVAARWEPLVQMVSNPGFATGSWTVYRATGLTPVPSAERTVREAEEAQMSQWWLPFDDAVDAVLGGRIANALTVAAVLAEAVRRRR